MQSRYVWASSDAIAIARNDKLHHLSPLATFPVLWQPHVLSPEVVESQSKWTSDWATPRRIRNCAEASVASLSTPTVVEICSTRVKKSWRYSYPLPAGAVEAGRSGTAFSVSRQRRRDKKGETKRGLKERERKAKAYPAVLHATANSRSDCNVRRFADFDGARIRRCEAADVSQARSLKTSSVALLYCVTKLLTYT